MRNKPKALLFIVSIAMLGLMLAPWSRLRSLAPTGEVGEVASEAEEFGREQQSFLDAAKLRELQLQDENGYIPPDGLLKARDHIRAMAAAQLQRAATLGEAPEAGGLAPGAWQWRGPGNIGGRIRSILINPSNAQQMWVGSVSGGIWTTTDGGASWSPVNDFLANLNVSTMVMNPVTPATMYAGTGESSRGDAGRGQGLFMSDDDGVTWSQVAGTETWYYVNRLDISPDGTTLLAATNTNLWHSLDGGLNWTEVLIGGIQDVNFAPGSNTEAVASDNGWAGYSTDGGATWTPANVFTATGRIEVAYAPSDTSIVYASVNVNNGELWKSADGGQNYAPVNTGKSLLSGQGWYDNIVWVDPTNPDVVIVGGVDLWRSIDGGATMTQISSWQEAPNSAHADHHMIVAHPDFDGASNTTVFFGNDGGLYQTNNVYTVAAGPAPNGWQALNNNLGITQFYGASVGPTGRLSGGTQDNGDLTDNFSLQNWTSLLGGDGGFSASDPVDANYIYGEYTFLSIHRNNTGGASQSEDIDGRYWNGASTVWKNPPYRINDAMNETANFIAPFVLDPNNRDRLLGGGLSLWRTNDVRTPTTPTTGPSWSAIKAPTGADPNVNSISAIAVAQGNSDMIWAGHNNGDVFMTTNGTAANPIWTQVDNGVNPLPDRYVLRLTVDPNDSNRVYATFGGFTPDNVLVTTDGGTTWSDITGSGPTGLPDAPVRSLVIHPSHSDWLYVATEVGVLASEDSGATWDVTLQGPANVSVDELFWGGASLYAATHGRGLYSINLASNTLFLPLVQR